MWTNGRRAVLSAAAFSAVVVAAPLGGTAHASEPVVASPSPPVDYTNTTACLTAADVGGTVENGISWAQRQLDYPSLREFSGGGARQQVAVIDTGVNPVSAFGGRLTGGGDYVVDGGTGLADCDGHGTLVAGIIAASPDPASGFAGVAPDARLISIRQSSSRYGVQGAGQGSAGTTASLAQAVLLAVTSGASIINISETSCREATATPDLGGPALQDAVSYAAAKDVVIIAAAGNVDGSTGCRTQNTPGRDPATIPTPARLPGVLAVGAADQRGRPAPFSLAGAWVGVTAPGVDIISTDPVAGTVGQIDRFGTRSGASPIQGTSFAAAYVTGLVALVRARFPGLRAAQVIARVEQTAQHPSAPGGRNDFVGHGMIDPRGALTDLLPGEDGSTPAPRRGPSVLPAAVPHPDRDEAGARLVASTGSLGLLAVAAAGRIAMSTRRRRADRLALRAAAARRGGR